MDNLIYLKCNTGPVLLNNLVTSDGKLLEAIEFQPGTIWYDNQGNIRQFSLYYNGRNYDNYFLVPAHSDTKKIIRTISGDLAEFGIKVIASSIFSGGTLIINLAKFLFEKYGKIALTDLMQGNSDIPMAYVSLAQNQIVFQGVLNIRMTIGVHYPKMFIKNEMKYTIAFEVSGNLADWSPGNIGPNSITEIYFPNRQANGYVRFYAGPGMGRIYEIRAPETYSIYWDNALQLWALSFCQIFKTIA